MKKIIVYLPEDIGAALGRVAAEREKSEAELVREAVRELVRNSERPKPRLPLFRSNDPTLAERLEEELTGFGER